MYAIFLYRIEMYIVGGFLDSRNISEDVFMQILRKYIFVILETLKCLYHGFGVCISRKFRVF
jgi:hypothetical protein